MANLADRIISIFLDQETSQLRDVEICNALTQQGLPCDKGSIRHEVTRLSPALFQTELIDNDELIINVRPKIEICQDFAQGRCLAPSKTCVRLHICSFIGRCTKPDCRRPHDLMTGFNRQIVFSHRCERIDAILLVKLLRLQSNGATPAARRPGRGARFARGGRRGSRFRPPRKEEHLLSNDLDRQVDVIYPSSHVADQIDWEIVSLLLNKRGVAVESAAAEHENEYFRRTTILLKEIRDLNKLLVSPVLTYQNLDVKCKRTSQVVDRAAFLLKIKTNDQQVRIESHRLGLYVKTLIGPQHAAKTTDRSSSEEQIILVHADADLNFDELHRAHQSRPQLTGRDVAMVQIYQPDAVEVRYKGARKSMSLADLQTIFQSVWKDVFAFDFPSDKPAEVEFITAEALKQWMSSTEYAEQQPDIVCELIISEVEDANDCQSTTSARPSLAEFDDTRSNSSGEQLGGHADVHGDTVVYKGSFPEGTSGTDPRSQLHETTKKFAGLFSYPVLDRLDENQRKILEENADKVVFRPLNENEYRVIAKVDVMVELRKKLSFRPGPPQRRLSTAPRPADSTPSLKPVAPSSEQLTSRDSTPPAPVPPTLQIHYPITSPEQRIMFSNQTFTDELRDYLKKDFRVEVFYGGNPQLGKVVNTIVEIHGSNENAHQALEYLKNLLSSLTTEIFGTQPDDQWTRIPEAISVLQDYFKRTRIFYACQRDQPNQIRVYFFDQTIPHFGIPQNGMRSVLKDVFTFKTIPYKSQAPASQFSDEWTELERQVRQRDDYGKQICLMRESNGISLFGVNKLVKQCEQAFEELRAKQSPKPCRITLSDRQLNYLTHVATADFAQLAKEYKPLGCELSLAKLRDDCEFLAPLHLHTTIRDALNVLTEVQETTFDVDEPGFEVFVAQHSDRLMSLVKSKCYLEKSISTCRTYIPVPRARGIECEQTIKPSPLGASASASVANDTKSVTIGHSTVSVVFGDLATQPVDAIVLCPSSQYLCEKIINGAGPQVKSEYQQLVSSDTFPGTTSGGELRCQKIFFIHWSPSSRKTDEVNASLVRFVATAFALAQSTECKTIAFPPVGCGKHNFDPSFIAEYTLRETRKQLLGMKSKMRVSFVLLKEDQHVYDAFVKRLDQLQAVDPAVSTIPPKRATDAQSEIPYDRKIIRITLISSQEAHRSQCRREILQLAAQSSFKLNLTDKQDMLEWSQSTIDTFYQLCLKDRVIPKMNLDDLTLNLIGPEDAVRRAESKFHEMTNERMKEILIHAASQHAIWWIETDPNSNEWQQYSYTVNGMIEDAYSRKRPLVKFSNDANEQCCITFSAMEERKEGIRHRVRRSAANSELPHHWDVSDPNRKRVLLPPQSAEYKKVLERFDATMAKKYSQIIRIERIQNERWYKQYAAQLAEFLQRYPQPNERLLFHGCSNDSAEKIIDQCFNRSYAGANGTRYGHGAYFHANAAYSHQYAQMDPSGEKTVFSARVLIGKTIKGDDKMKAPPAGYDTTTDGEHIFVVYHDAGAYAEHLITYK